ncbi:MAG: 2-oxo acid dehydrogenase subunit E2 [Pseudomonadota bacterium]|nr:2-oxo acid dehydrogenase subunit E2 [Pseudomonadota bacterium]
MDILMPQLGETVTEGKIISWQRSVGDLVANGDVLFEIETDKVSMEVPATCAGRIAEIRVNAGDTAPVGAIVATIADEAAAAGDAQAPAQRSPAVSGAPSSPDAPTSAAGSPAAPRAPSPPSAPAKRDRDPFRAVASPERNFGPVMANGVATTPLARRLAADAGIDLGTVNGSGPQGRITGKDIQRGGNGAQSTSAAPAKQSLRALYDGVPFVEIPLDGMRRTIASRLVESKQTVPHFYLVADVDIENMLAIRKTANLALPAKLSVNDFVVKAFAMALLRVPFANAIWAEDRILRFTRVDVGVAVAVEGGLFTPVVRDAGAKSVTAISAEIRELAERAKNRKLKPHEYQGGSATVSNLGMYGVRQFSAIITPPQASILAVGAAARRAVENADGSVRFSSQMTVTLSCDHRVVDGALGAELLAAFKKIIEEPILTLI